MSQKAVLLCDGDQRQAGCGGAIALVDRDEVISAGGSEILSYDRLGRARIACRCGAITMTRGQTTTTR